MVLRGPRTIDIDRPLLEFCTLHREVFRIRDFGAKLLTLNATSSGWTLSIHPQPMTSLSGAPRYSSIRLLTYSKLPSGAALHTSVGIASTSKRSSCSLLVSASSALLPSFGTSTALRCRQRLRATVGGTGVRRPPPKSDSCHPGTHRSRHSASRAKLRCRASGYILR